MTILGTFTKQPIEVEIYAVQFAEDMPPSDSLTGGYQVVTHNGRSTGTLILSAPYPATIADSFKTLRTTSDVTLPVAAPDGFTLYVANANQSAAITVGSLTVPARGAIIVVRKAGVWVAEMTANGIVVSMAGDHRVRCVIAGGLNSQTYKAEITATTSEGRVMQDEILIKVKEY